MFKECEACSSIMHKTNILGELQLGIVGLSISPLANQTDLHPAVCMNTKGVKKKHATVHKTKGRRKSVQYSGLILCKFLAFQVSSSL
jgi:hypothetical protein